MYIYNDLISKIEKECKVISKEIKKEKFIRVNSSQIKYGIVRGIMTKNSDLENSVCGTAIELSSLKSQEIYSNLYKVRIRSVALRSNVSSQTFLGMSAGKTIGVSVGKSGVTKQIGYNE